MLDNSKFSVQFKPAQNKSYSIISVQVIKLLYVRPRFKWLSGNF